MQDDVTPECHEDLDDYINPLEEDKKDFIDFQESPIPIVRDGDSEVVARWEQLWALQEHYADFRDFYRDVSEELLGFTPTALQYDIADFCQTSGIYSMIQAYRGAAKTTITGCYAVWCWIHNPATIILIVSAGGDLARDISTWVIQILTGMPELDCMVPDKNHATTRTSLEKYDIHHDLKGVDKSPSLASVGVTSNMQGKRAHLLIADDVESSKNSMTQTMRDQLLEKTRDFISINREGKILYLGTPQSTDSIYNTLPGRGYSIRIWPGRVPTEKEVGNYKDMLAPIVTAMLKSELQTGYGVLGDRGAPTDAHMMSERMLCDRELDQGPAYFNLQYMLDTALADADRFPLKAVDMMFMPLDLDEAPGKFIWGPSAQTALPNAPGCELGLQLYSPANVRTETFPYTTRLLSLDPSGESKKNNDETGYAVVFVCNGYYFCMQIGGIKNASTPEGQAFIASLMRHWKINQVIVERNYGGGIFTNMIEGTMNANHIKAGIEEVWSTGQKEIRIIDSIQPILAYHRVVFNQAIINDDFKSVQHYPTNIRNAYRFMHQLVKLTRDRGALLHDDRVEALAIALRFLKDQIKVDATRQVHEAEMAQMIDWMKNPRGITTRNPGAYKQKTPGILSNVMQRFNKRRG